MNMEFIGKLPIPQEIKEKYPLSKEAADLKSKIDNDVKSILDGNSGKKLLVIGPCSADNETAVLDYVSRLKRVQDKVYEKIVIIPRIYCNKPRTTGSGYKGLLHYPDPTEKPDLIKGVISSRILHMKSLTECGMSSADEMLYPGNHRYLSDLLSYVSIGARSVENQEHRLTASGLDIPAGMKNPTSGNFSVMFNAIFAAQHSHTFCYRGWEVKSKGNPYAHAVIRGRVDFNGNSISNYHYDDLMYLQKEYTESSLSNPSIIVDTNHCNSNKNYMEQIDIVKDVLNSCKKNEEIKSIIKGFMIESYIENGCQNIGDNIYGKSITDPCLGWEETEKLIYEIAENC